MLGVGLLLLVLVTGCGSSDEEPVQPVRPYTSPSTRTVNPTPTYRSGEEQTLTIAQSTQGRMLGLHIGVQDVGGGEASLSIIEASDPEGKGEGVTGSAGDSFSLDSGYTVTIDAVTEAESPEDVAGGESGKVTLTVRAPDGDEN
ncbi:hypothetical protein GCM10009799_31280 [Nocardiopsis rhodophaea]|uniref:Lipoprotein n=1 Tax=Nocardiopsis rhodophaea TaxID=280238 RepID=A0ABN2T8P2_9ACTN